MLTAHPVLQVLLIYFLLPKWKKIAPFHQVNTSCNSEKIIILIKQMRWKWVMPCGTILIVWVLSLREYGMKLFCASPFTLLEACIAMSIIKSELWQQYLCFFFYFKSHDINNFCRHFNSLWGRKSCCHSSLLFSLFNMYTKRHRGQTGIFCYVIHSSRSRYIMVEMVTSFYHLTEWWKKGAVSTRM